MLSSHLRRGAAVAIWTLDITGARAFGSKFRAITRAITLGQSGDITVTRGQSSNGNVARQNDKTAGQRLLTCGFRGGQGRGRTADLPIFRKNHLAGRPGQFAGNCAKAASPDWPKRQRRRVGPALGPIPFS